NTSWCSNEPWTTLRNARCFPFGEKTTSYKPRPFASVVCSSVSKFHIASTWSEESGRTARRTTFHPSGENANSSNRPIFRGSVLILSPVLASHRPTWSFSTLKVDEIRFPDGDIAG